MHRALFSAKKFRDLCRKKLCVKLGENIGKGTFGFGGVQNEKDMEPPEYGGKINRCVFSGQRDPAGCEQLCAVSCGGVQPGGSHGGDDFGTQLPDCVGHE